ncbi:Crp/Fnr family transcriptional regulator [Thioclava dalianensis]|uniref:Crp/Fnr family transcriptional regulator n=1 Tax=Thioclava dalianensis TaxID=1185766 RepID=UPI000A936671|nr:Crp/Fnr family transcriptional regulator [Thioclava dalianensis]
MTSIITHEQSFSSGATVTCSRESAALSLVSKGIGLRYCLLENGRRQIEGLIYPGDVLGLGAGLSFARQSVAEAATPMRLGHLDAERMEDRRTREDMMWLLAYENDLLAQWLATTGQRNAIEGISWFVHHAYQRALQADLLTRGAAPFPFPQQVLADALGLSLVHTNKTLRRLRDRKLFRIERGFVHIPSLPQLRAVAGL